MVIILFALAVEGWQMFKVWKSDKQLNEKEYTVYLPWGTKDTKTCADLKAGDIIRME